jgi:branched-chain amino acid transport system permease protein
MKKTVLNKQISTVKRYIINIVLFAIFLALITALTNTGVVSYSNSKVLMLIAINIILAVSLNVATGYLGQLPLDRSFMLWALIPRQSSWLRPALPPQLIFPVALCLRRCCSLVRNYYRHSGLRLKGDYLAIITFASANYTVILLNIDSVLGLSLPTALQALKTFQRQQQYLMPSYGWALYAL